MNDFVIYVGKDKNFNNAIQTLLISSGYRPLEASSVNKETGLFEKVWPHFLIDKNRKGFFGYNDTYSHLFEYGVLNPKEYKTYSCFTDMEIILEKIKQKDEIIYVFGSNKLVISKDGIEYGCASLNSKEVETIYKDFKSLQKD